MILIVILAMFQLLSSPAFFRCLSQHISFYLDQHVYLDCYTMFWPLYPLAFWLVSMKLSSAGIAYINCMTIFFISPFATILPFFMFICKSIKENFLEEIMRKDCLKNLTLTGHVEDKRSRRKQ